MGEQVKTEERPRKVVDATHPHRRQFFTCTDKPPGETVHGGPWKQPDHGIAIKEKR
jgi:hypothetical protein